MISNETNLSILWPCLHSIHSIPWNLSCILCRLGGIFIFIISIICFILNIRFLFYQRRQNNLVISLFVASLSVLTIGVPIVVIQLLTCHRHCLKFFCRMEGFISYLSGCLCMLIFMALSVHRYLAICSCNRLSYRVSTFMCWFFSIAFTSPLLLDYFNAYIPEGLGFHCSINWSDQSTISRIYIFSSFFLMYFLPLIVLCFVNSQVHVIIQNIYSKHYLNYSFQQYSSQTSSKILNRRNEYFEQIHDSKYYIHQAHDRKRFRNDYRFLRAILFLVCSYLIAWTPYSIIAILQLFNIKFIIQHTFIITLTAFIAKLSVVISPIVYVSVMNYRLFKKLLFQ